MIGNALVLVVDPCECGGIFVITDARIEDENGVIEATCQKCGKVTTIEAVAREVDHE